MICCFMGTTSRGVEVVTVLAGRVEGMMAATASGMAVGVRTVMVALTALSTTLHWLLRTC
jgi:hypothetical protein